jgi:hypothetical protein
MITKELKYTRKVDYRGRNGTFTCTGLDFTYSGKDIHIRPFSTKGLSFACRIEIPLEHLDDVIRILQEIKAQNPG